MTTGDAVVKKGVSILDILRNSFVPAAKVSRKMENSRKIATAIYIDCCTNATDALVLIRVQHL